MVMPIEQRVRSSRDLKRWHREVRPLLPTCGAKAKSTGEPCRRWAMANGKCQFHGGRTGSQWAWHRVRWPNGKSPDAEKKLVRKLRNRERAEKARKKRIEAMSPAERELYERRRRAMAPGTPAARARRRAERKQAADARKRIEAMEREPTPVNPEAEALARRIGELEQRKALLAALAEGDGIFG